MIPKLEKISSAISSSIAVKREVTPYMDYPLHYHPEYEIIYVAKSYGIRLMGSHIGNFREDALGKDFFQLPEFAGIRKLFKAGQQGLLYSGKSKEEIASLIKKVYHSKGIDWLSQIILSYYQVPIKPGILTIPTGTESIT
jgi:hypothetical protein